MTDTTVCLVIGGTQGIGKLIAEELLKDSFKVVVADVDQIKGDAFLNQATQSEIPDDQVKFIKYNPHEAAALLQVYENARAWCGHLHVVCHAAHTVGRDPGEARRLLEQSVQTSVVGTYKAIEVMSKRHGGVGGLVVNIGSNAGARVDQLAASYATAETGVVVAFTRSFSLFPHSADDGVRVNCICPSSCGETDALRRVWERRPSNQEFVAKEGSTSAKAVVNAFMKCLLDDNMNGNVLAIIPPDNIVQC